jgi:hypothetical protein
VFFDHRRKLSAVNKEHLGLLIYQIMVEDDKDRKWELLQKTRLERTIWFYVLKEFHERIKTYLELENTYINGLMSGKSEIKLAVINKQMYDIERQFGSKRSKLGPAIRWSQEYFDLYIEFKNSVIKKYVRLAYQETSKIVRYSKVLLDRKSVFDNLLLSVSKAIDKFDSSKGTLTGYIQFWFMDAKSNSRFTHEDGRAYDVSTNKRRQISDDYSKGISADTNLSYSIEKYMHLRDDKESIEEEMVNHAHEKNFIKIINQVRSTRAVHLVMDIPYILNQDELDLFETVAI